MKIVDEMAPVPLDVADYGFRIAARNVVADEEHATVALGGSAFDVEFVVPAALHSGARCHADVALQSGAIDAIFRHPSEMQVHGAGLGARVELDWRAVLSAQSRGAAGVRRIFRNIGQQFNTQVRGVRNAAFEPMDPIFVSVIVAGAAEPALIAD